MKIWRFSDPRDYTRYARATQVDMYTPLKIDAEGNIDPLVMEWEPDSDVVADFTWPALAMKIVVTEAVGLALIERFHGVRLGPVEMVQSIPLEKLLRQRQRGKKRVLLPYEGPKLVNLFITKSVNVNIERSSLEKKVDSTTGKITYEVEGVEEYAGRWDASIGLYYYERVPKVPEKGIYVDANELDGADFFCANQLRACIFCTDQVKFFIEKKGYSNVQFLEYGDVL